MNAFSICLVMMWLAISCCTIPVIEHHGLGLFRVFFGDMSAFGWPGQSNFDFLLMFVLSALWVAWRNGFSAVGLGLGFITHVADDVDWMVGECADRRRWVTSDGGGCR